MYTKFISSNNQEYYKIIKIIDSCQTEDHMLVVANCFKAFANNCDHRLLELKKYRNSHPFTSSNWENVKKYDALTRDQIEMIRDRVQVWSEAYSEFVMEEQKKKEERKNKPKKIKKIQGFNKLF